MSNKIVLVAETGSDLTPELAKEYGVYLVPMHVSMGDETLDDGSFPPEDVCAYYDRTGKVPQTSASNPSDFTKVFDEIHQRWPEKHILHLAYSAVTTCSYHSCELAIEGKPYEKHVRLVDTRQVSVGQGAVVLAVHDWLEAHPDATLEEAAAAAEAIAESTQMCFVPRNLDYLRAGGRCSNATALVGNLLKLHPCIEIIGGKLIAGKKYRGDLAKLAPILLREFAEKHNLRRDHIRFIQTPYMEDAIRTVLDAEAAALGFQKITWVKTGCVITCHGGSGAFGIVGSSNK